MTKNPSSSLLSPRRRCACGITVQRDVWSAYLARFAQTEIGPDGPRWHLDAESARQAFSGAEKHLPAASIPASVQAFATWARDHQPASAAPSGGSHLPNGGSEWVAGAVGTRAREGAEAIPPQAGALGRARRVATRTPRL